MYAINLNKPILFYKSGEFTSKPGWTHKKMHHDRDFELILCIQGTLELKIDGQQLMVHENECLLLPPNVTIQGSQPATDKIDFYWVHFFASWKDLPLQASSIQLALPKIRHHQFTQELNDLVLLPKLFKLDNANGIVILINQLLNTNNSYHYSQHSCDCLIQTILIELSNIYLTSLSNKTDKSTLLTNKIIEWIRANMSSTISVQSIADHFELNPDYLTRIFKREQHGNLRSYLINLKLEVAKILLIKTTLSVNQISDLAYFNDPKNFMRMFKQRTLMTASEYRKIYSNTHLNNPNVDPSIPIPQEIEVKLDLLRNDF
ncbi:AraC family transcriptional regulator [Dellaglioa sp. L3N]